jgi:argininosuccinate lyase
LHLQEDKPPTFDAFDTVDSCLEILSGSIATVRFNKERMQAALSEGFIDATELADCRILLSLTPLLGRRR